MATAARLVRHGAPLRIEDVDLPEPGAGEVRVDLAFGGVNPVDRYTAQGTVAPDGPVPRTLGGEASGHVDGRPVLVAGAGLGARRDGVWATAAVVPQASVVPLPDGVELRDAAAMGVAGLTAWNVLSDAGVGEGDRVLVLGASGGVGQVVVSLAASLGAQVCGQTGNAGKVDAVRRQGADRVVVADAGALGDAVAGFAPTVVVDPLGGGFTGAALRLLQTHGRLVLFGTSADSEGTLPLQQLYRKGLRVFGYAGLLLSDDARRAGLASALDALADGRLRVTVDRVVRLDEVDEAFRLIVDRAVTGKVLLDLSRG